MFNKQSSIKFMVMAFVLGAFQPALAAYQVGDTAANFTLPRHGTTTNVSLYDYAGQIIVLDFWAYWCGPCRTASSELEPYIQQYYQNLGGNPTQIPVTLISINIESGNPAETNAYIATYGLETVLDDFGGIAFGAFGGSSIPQIAIVNGKAGTNYGQWEVLYNSAGYGSGMYTNFRTIIDGIRTIDPIGLEEFSLLSSYWGMTDCNETQPCSDADWFTDGTIDILDLQQLAISWLGDEMIYDAPQGPEITDGFETGDFSALPWTLSGNANWSVISGAFEGTYATKSGTIADNQSSTLEVAINTGDASSISFARKVSSESGYDYLKFYIDGVEKNKWSGTLDWATQTFTFTPGQHTFKWSYTKDYSVSSGSDCTWIDNVRIFKP